VSKKRDLICDVNHCAWAAKQRYGRAKFNDVNAFFFYEVHSHINLQIQVSE